MAHPPIAAIIYDCDGTLVDSERLNARGMTDLIATDHGIQLDPAALESEFRGGRFADMCATLEARHAIALGADYITRYRAYSLDLFERELQPMPGVREAIETIGSPRCVASSGPPVKLAKALAVTDLARYFGEWVFSAYDIKAWKPDPALFLHAARVMGVNPAACAVIEDSNAGVEAGIRAGMRVFAYDRHGAVSPRFDAEIVRFGDYALLPGLIARG